MCVEWSPPQKIGNIAVAVAHFSDYQSIVSTYTNISTTETAETGEQAEYCIARGWAGDQHKENQSVGDLNHSNCSSSHMRQRFELEMIMRMGFPFPLGIQWESHGIGNS